MEAAIVINIEDGLDEQEEKDLAYLLSDALAEFAKTRQSVDVYMRQRYPASKTCECHDGRFGPASPNCQHCKGTGMQRLYSEDFLATKRADVERRVALAKKLCQAQVRNPLVMRQKQVRLTVADAVYRGIRSGALLNEDGDAEAVARYDEALDRVITAAKGVRSE